MHKCILELTGPLDHLCTQTRLSSKKNFNNDIIQIQRRYIYVQVTKSISRAKGEVRWLMHNSGQWWLLKTNYLNPSKPHMVWFSHPTVNTTQWNKLCSCRNSIMFIKGPRTATLPVSSPVQCNYNAISSSWWSSASSKPNSCKANLTVCVCFQVFISTLSLSPIFLSQSRWHRWGSVVQN